MADNTFYVQGLGSLSRAFTGASRELGKEVKNELRVVAEPVRARAEVLAVQRISHMGPLRARSWAGMRVGATSKAVYIAPKRRGRRGSKRPNLANLLLDRAMEPALAENRSKIEARMEILVDSLLTSHNL